MLAKPYDDVSIVCDTEKQYLCVSSYISNGIMLLLVGGDQNNMRVDIK